MLYIRTDLEKIIAGLIVTIGGIEAPRVRRMVANITQPTESFICLMCEKFDIVDSVDPYIDDDVKYWRMSATFRLECLGEDASDHLHTFRRNIGDTASQELQDGLSLGAYFPDDEIAYEAVVLDGGATVRIGSTTLNVRYIQSEANTDTTGFAKQWIATMLVDATEGDPDYSNTVILDEEA